MKKDQKLFFISLSLAAATIVVGISRIYHPATFSYLTQMMLLAATVISAIASLMQLKISHD